MTINLLSLFNNRNYQTYNRIVAKKFGIKAAIMLGELVNRYEYHFDKGQLSNFEKHGDGWFYFTVDMCEERTCLTEKEQLGAISILESHGLFEKKSIGLPAKRHFRINLEKIYELVDVSNNFSSSDNRAELEPTKGRNSTRQNVGAIHIKESKEDLYKNNNPDGVESPSAVVVLLEKLNLDEGQKQKLVKDYTQEQLEYAVEQCLLWNGRKSDMAAVRYILDPKNKWKSKESVEDMTEKNKEFLKTLQCLDNRKIGKGCCMTISVGYKSFEVHGGMVCIIASCDEPDMKLKINETLKKYGTSLEELKTLPK